MNVEDKLKKVKEEIEGTIKEFEIPFMYVENVQEIIDCGSFSTKNKILYCDNKNFSFEMFLKLIKTLKVSILYLQIDVFNYADFIETSENKSGAEKQFEKYDGYIENITLFFRIEEVWHIFMEIAEWSPNVGSKEIDEKDEQEEMTDDEKEKYAKEIACDNEYPLKKEAILRRLKKKYPKDFGKLEWNIEDITSIAKGIYEDEILPEKNKERYGKAKKMRKEGKSRRQISIELSISEKEVSKLFEKFDSSSKVDT